MVTPIASIFGGVEPMLIVGLVVLVLFGGKKIPELMRGVGQGVGELKKGLEDGQRQMHDAIRHDDAPVTPVVPVAPVTPVAPVAETVPANTTPAP